MSRAETVCRLIDVTLTPQQIAACRCLERAGQRFLIDFGYDNAIDKARAYWRSRRQSRKAEGR